MGYFSPLLGWRTSFYNLSQQKGPRDTKGNARKYIEQQAVEEAIGLTGTGPDILFRTYFRVLGIYINCCNFVVQPKKSKK